MNRKGEKPVSLTEDGKSKESKKPVDLATQDNISRFDSAKKKKKKKKKVMGAKEDQPKGNAQEPKANGQQQPATDKEKPKQQPKANKEKPKAK